MSGLKAMLFDTMRFQRRYTIFCGSNYSKEWFQAFRDWRKKEAINLPDVIQAYETYFANTVGASQGISFGAGRMALYAILEALNIGQGDEVIIPAFTCVVVPNALLYRGIRPVYVDINPRTFNIDVCKIEEAITSKTRALYAQHTFGVPCDMDQLRQIAERHNLPIIEDAAHALGTCVGEKKVGSLTAVAFFSTDHSKVINTHLGGMATTSDETLAERLSEIKKAMDFLPLKDHQKLLRTFLFEYINFSPRVYSVGQLFQALLNKFKFSFYFTDELMTERPTNYPYPCRLSGAQARLGLTQLHSLRENIAHRQKIAKLCEQSIGWYKMCDEEMNACAWLRYSFLVKDREAFIERFSKRLDLGIWFTSIVHGRERDMAAVGYETGSCPTAEWVARHIVNFPTHQRIPFNLIQKALHTNLDWLMEELLQKDKGW